MALDELRQTAMTDLGHRSRESEQAILHRSAGVEGVSFALVLTFDL